MSQSQKGVTFYSGNDSIWGYQSLLQPEPAETALFIAEIVEFEVIC